MTFEDISLDEDDMLHSALMATWFAVNFHISDTKVSKFSIHM